MDGCRCRCLQRQVSNNLCRQRRRQLQPALALQRYKPDPKGDFQIALWSFGGLETAAS